MVFTAIRGRDGGSANPLNIPNGLASECMNVELDGTVFAVKRLGYDAQSTGTFPNGDNPDIWLVHERANRGDVVFYGIDYTGGTNTLARYPLSGPWSVAFTLSDNPDGDQTPACGVAFHDKFFLAHNTAVDRLHVIDGNGTTLRRVGIAPPAAAPTVADTGSGSYAATQRWYQQSFRNISGTTVLAESERSSSVAFTPSGSGTHARVTKAATPAGETVTHWVLWASETGTDGPFYELAETAIGTSTYDDNAAPASYDDGTAAQVAGTFTVPTSAKYLLNDGSNRILMAGAYESGGYESRVWFTPALGSLGRGDDERIPNTSDLQYWIDIEEDNGGKITGLGGPLNGQPIVFKASQVWRLVPTGDVDAPYRPVNITRSVGCINHRTIAMGLDETGSPCLYFAAADGVYRFGRNGLQYIGFDIEDLWNARANAGAFAGFYGKRRQYWLQFPIVETSARVRFCADLGRPDETGRVRGGWVRDSNSSAAVTYLPFNFAASAESSLMYGQRNGLVRFDSTTADESAFQSYVDIQAQAPAGLGTRVTTGAPMLVAKSGTGTPTITVQQQKNYSSETRDATGTLSTQLAHIRCDQGGGMQDCDAIGFRVGDGSAQDVKWTIDAVVVPWEPGEDTLQV